MARRTGGIRRRTGAAAARREQRQRIGGNEAVAMAAELAGHADHSLLGQDALDFGAAEHPAARWIRARRSKRNESARRAARTRAGRGRESARRAAPRRPSAPSSSASPRSSRDCHLSPREVVPGPGARHPLEQQAAHPRRVGGEHQPAVDLLGGGEVVLDQRGDRRRLERDDPLVDRAAVLGVEHDREAARRADPPRAPAAARRPARRLRRRATARWRAGRGRPCIRRRGADRARRLQLNDERALEA